MKMLSSAYLPAAMNLDLSPDTLHRAAPEPAILFCSMVFVGGAYWWSATLCSFTVHTNGGGNCPPITIAIAVTVGGAIVIEFVLANTIAIASAGAIVASICYRCSMFLPLQLR